MWELGTLMNSNNLAEIPMKSHGLKNFIAVIVLDLSQPDRLWTDLEFALNELKTSYKKCKIDDDMYEMSSKRVGIEHTDIRTLDLFPFPVVLIGGKYDLFENQDPEIKKHVCRCLRSVSHSIGAALLFYSIKHSNLVRILRDTLTFLGFGSPAKPFRSINLDYNQPLVVPFGSDSWEKIGVLPTNSERIGYAYKIHIPQVENPGAEEEAKSSLSSNDGSMDSGFREPVVDELRAQKDEELSRLIRDREMRNKFEGVLVQN